MATTTRNPIDPALLKLARARARKSALPGYLTTKDVSELTGLDVSELSRKHTAGTIKAIKVGTQLFFTPASVAQIQRRPPGNPNFLRK